MTTKQRIILSLSALFALGAFYGCNTSEGFGEDVEEAGEEIQEEAS